MAEVSGPARSLRLAPGEWAQVLAMAVTVVALLAAGGGLLVAGEAFSRPIRKVYYNLIITGLSVAVAFAIGSIELLGLLGSEVHAGGWSWSAMADFNINTAGFAIVGLFVVTWAVALTVWHFGEVEDRWDRAAVGARAAAEAPGGADPEAAVGAGEPVAVGEAAGAAVGAGEPAG
jgi:hypothetical protein